MKPHASDTLIRTLLVEDEALSRNLVHQLLEMYCPEVRIIGEAAAAEEAAGKCDALKPDLVLLDIELAGDNAFSLLERYDTLPFRVIFMTSYDQYAIRAIRYAALDYLLKPLNSTELRAAIDRFHRSKLPPDPQTRLLPVTPGKNASLIALPAPDGFEVVPLDEIIYCEASGNYTFYFLTNGKKLIVSRTLKESEQLLQNQGFLRIHQSYLVNLTHVRKYVKSAGGSVIMTNKGELSVSPKRRENLISALMRL